MHVGNRLLPVVDSNTDTITDAYVHTDQLTNPDTNAD